ncbi:GntR family transcriptional regulator, partial [Muricoccus aerilatus]|uniref:GntR family transcriptional regulator n=1 Tax=Muricoccus aerilatus TaxID=452982 RepID=UPI0005C14D7E
MADGAYAHLHEMLLTHRLPHDAPVSERNLAAELDISRTPLREALRRLEGEGLLERLPGGVLGVRRITVGEFLEIQQLRRLLEGEAAVQAAGRVDQGLLRGLRARIASLLASSRPSPAQQQDRLAIDLALHRAIAAATTNATLARLLEDLRRRMLLFATPRPAERLEDVCAQYEAIIDALAGADPEAARSAMTRHVDALRTGILRHLAAL